MHNLLFLFIFILLSCQSSKTSNPGPLANSQADKATTQGNVFYKPFAEFNGDTLLKTNHKI